MMQRKLSAVRVAMIVCLAIGLVTVAGVVARDARAQTVYYCYDCVVGSTPAVSASGDYAGNWMDASGVGDLQVYFYNSSGDTDCSDAQDGVDYVHNPSCGPPVGHLPSTARCHTLHGTGPFYAYCYTDVVI